ncbi:T-box transcription factor TBX22 [Aplochiton taeniatus]
MQGLSTRAHAFSVEALVGKTCKRMKLENGREICNLEDTDSDQSTFISGAVKNGLQDSPTSQRKKGRRLTPMLGEGHESETEHLRKGDDETDSGGDTIKLGETEYYSEREVQVELQGSELWRRFHEIGTEMIITKAGRRMFPSVRIKVRNLDPCQQYYIAIDVLPVDSKRYRYVYHSSQWMVAGNTDHSCISPRLYLHPDSPCAGETWMRQVISFDRVKLTNNEMDDKGHVILQSMHKYKPRVHVIRHDPRIDLLQIQSLPAEGVNSFSFTETEFTTVTAYQNQQITKLKIDRNPFAKGFRDPGRNRGVLDGLLETYPWRSPLNLDLKPFTLHLQGSSGSPASSLKNIFPLSCPPSYYPGSLASFSDTSFHSLRLPLYCKASPISPLASRAYSSLGPDRLRALPPLSPLSDLSLLSALQGKKGPPCRGPCLQGSPGPSPCLLPLHLRPQGPSSSPHPLHPEVATPYCFYRYSLPLNSHLSALSRHAKLSDGTTDSLLRQSPWHSTTKHCL